MEPLITNDAVVLGILMVILGFVFYTSNSSNKYLAGFYKYFPAILLCYILPAILNTTGVISYTHSSLYKVATRYLLPVSLILLCISMDMKGIMRLGPKALIMFLTGTMGIVVGGPVALLVVSSLFPGQLTGEGANEVWRGLSTIAGSWIGGGANQMAMKEVFQPSNQLFSIMAVVDVVIANIWMAVLLYGAGIDKRINRYLKADASSIEELKVNIESYRLSILKIPTLTNTIVILAVGFGASAVSHLGADILTPWVKLNAPELEKFSLTSDFFWLVVIATTIGVVLSFTPARKLEGVGASRIGSVFIYFLVATIGMQMDLAAISSNLIFLLIGAIWMLVHVSLMLIVAKLIRAPFFLVAVGSQANVGGAASAPVVASAFHPSLASVGVLLAVFGYALGTYGGYICALLMQAID